MGSATKSRECEACLKPGLPAFHSTTCDRSSKPEWESQAGSFLIPYGSRFNLLLDSSPPMSSCGPVLDPRTKKVMMMSRVFVIARFFAMFVDSLFFYSAAVCGSDNPCLFMDIPMARAATIIRTCVDLVHVWEIWVRFRMPYVSEDSRAVGWGKLVWDPRAVMQNYLRSFHGFWLDVFVILPIPQVIVWTVVPRLVETGQYNLLLGVQLLTFVVQFFPKCYHNLRQIARLKQVNGYIFGTLGWNLLFNLFAYYIASYSFGGVWYLLSVQRIMECVQQNCASNQSCNFTCSEAVCSIFEGDPPVCLDSDTLFPFGLAKPAIPVITSNSFWTRILYPMYWGFLNLSSWANELEPSSDTKDLILSLLVALCGLTFFTLLLGNIELMLGVVTARERDFQLRNHDNEWWMKRRRLPSSLRKRVQRFELQKWEAVGDDEMDFVKDLPVGLRLDIKRYLCLDLIKKVPFFHNVDDVILDDICDRAKPLVFSRGEKIIKEGDPVRQMVFIVRGHVKSSQGLGKAAFATNFLEQGDFLGDELLTWCLRRPFIERLPSSSSTFACLDLVEAYGIDANDLRYITNHYRPEFMDRMLKQKARYHSSNWRTWAAITIQCAWRRYRKKTKGLVAPLVEENKHRESQLRRYAAILLSERPRDHLH